MDPTKPTLNVPNFCIHKPIISAENSVHGHFLWKLVYKWVLYTTITSRNFEENVKGQLCFSTLLDETLLPVFTFWLKRFIDRLSWLVFLRQWLKCKQLHSLYVLVSHCAIIFVCWHSCFKKGYLSDTIFSSNMIKLTLGNIWPKIRGRWSNKRRAVLGLCTIEVRTNFKLDVMFSRGRKHQVTQSTYQNSVQRPSL